MKNKCGILLSSILFLSLILSGCASLQKDVVMSTDSLIQDEDVDFLEERFAQFDSKVILEGSVAPESSTYRELDILDKDIENTIKASGVNKILDSRLYALQGLVNLLQGKKPKAKSLYNKSYESNKGDSYTVILGSRLGEVKALDDENIISGSNQSVLLVLEQGLNHYIKGEYTDCVAKLDSAFIELPDFYRVSYNDVRQNAWALRNNSNITDDKAVLSLLNKSSISVGDMILIAQETTDIFNTINGGTKFSETELFNRLKTAGYFDPCSNIEPLTKKDEVKKGQIVNRSFAARFLWNVNCVRKNYDTQKTRNSSFYRQTIGYSPIPDVELSDSDFDAILGVVEQEIMSLPDGVSFNPTGLVGASEFNQWIQQIR